jgi:hypothetical protein
MPVTWRFSVQGGGQVGPAGGAPRLISVHDDGGAVGDMMVMECRSRRARHATAAATALSLGALAGEPMTNVARECCRL